MHDHMMTRLGDMTSRVLAWSLVSLVTEDRLGKLDLASMASLVDPGHSAWSSAKLR